MSLTVGIPHSSPFSSVNVCNHYSPKAMLWIAPWKCSSNNWNWSCEAGISMPLISELPRLPAGAVLVVLLSIVPSFNTVAHSGIQSCVVMDLFIESAYLAVDQVLNHLCLSAHESCDRLRSGPLQPWYLIYFVSEARQPRLVRNESGCQIIVSCPHS